MIEKMRICKITVPPLKNYRTQKLQRSSHILPRLERRGHEIVSGLVRPFKIGNPYISYGLGAFFFLLGFRKFRCDVILADNLESAFLAAAVKYLYRVPFIFDFIDDYSAVTRWGPSKTRYFFNRFMEKYLPGHADTIIVVDKHKKRFCESLGIPGGKIRLIPNGTDIRRFEARARPTRSNRNPNGRGQKTVLFIGKLNEYYRVELILEAAAVVLEKLPNTKLVVVGDGEKKRVLKEYCREMKIDKSVIFAGFRPYDEIPDIIGMADVCVFSLPDSSALAIYEYMACGKPIVATGDSTEKMGFDRDIIPKGCVITTSCSPREFAEGILILLENKELGKQMGKRAGKLAETAFSWDRIAERYESVIGDVVPKVSYYVPNHGIESG